MLLRALIGLGLVGVITPAVTTAQPSQRPRIVRSVAPLLDGGELFDNNAEYLARISRDSAVFTIAWSPDGRSLAIGTEDGAVHIWELASGQERIRIQAPPPVESLAFSPDGKRLAVASKHKGVRVWDPTTGDETLLYVPGNVSAVSYRPDGKTLACGFIEGHIDLWNLQDNTRAHRFEGHTDRVNSMAWNRDGQLLASGSWDGTIGLWSPEGSEEARALKVNDSLVHSVSWSSDGGRLASGSSDGTVLVWDAATGEELGRFEGTREVVSVAWSDDGRSIASGDSGHTVRLWDLSSEKDVLVLDRHEGRVNALVMRSGMLASGSGDGTVRLWDVGTGREIRRFEGHASAITAATWSADITRLAVVYENQDIRLWDLNANTEEWRIEELSNSAITSVALGPGGTRLAVGFENGSMAIWNTDSTLGAGGIRQPLTFGRHRGQRVSALAWSHDGRMVASGDWGGRLFLWDLEKNNPPSSVENELVGHTDDILALAWSTDDKTLVSASSDGSLNVWRFVDGVMQGRRLEGCPKSISALAFDAADTTVVMGMNNGTLRYWDLESGKQRTAQKFSGRYPKVVGVSSDRRVLASTDRGSQKGLLQIWIRSGDQSTYKPTHRLISGKRHTWIVCQSSKKCLRYDDGTLLVLQRGPGLIESVSLGAEPSDLELLSVPGEVVTADGEASSFNLRVRNRGSQVFWVDVLQVESDTEDMRLRFYPPPTQVRIDPGKEVDLPCLVSLASDYENPQKNALPLRLRVVSSNAGPLTIEPISVRSTVTSLRWVGSSWLQDGDDTRLLVSISNVGEQVLPPTRFFAELSDIEHRITATMPRPIQPGETTTVPFDLVPELEVRPKRGMKVTVVARKLDHPIHQWEFSNQKITITYPPSVKFFAAALIIGIGLVAYYYFGYKHPIVSDLLVDSKSIWTRHPVQLDQLKRQANRSQLKIILNRGGVQAEQFESAIEFLRNDDPGNRCRLLARWPGVSIGISESEDRFLRTMHLGTDFPLNLERCFLYLPPAEFGPDKVWALLQNNYELQDEVTLIISANFDCQEQLSQRAKDTSNLRVAPDPTELSSLLLSSDPTAPLSRLVASQVRRTRISPYITRGGVEKERVFFGRRHILSDIMNRNPSNYFIVGGRRMGKSSLLKAILRRHPSGPDVKCHYLVLSDDELVGRLSSAIGLTREAGLEDTIAQLAAERDRRLILIDEADRFIRSERSRGFATLNRLRSLSEENRCHFILAGFWELYEAAVMDYHSPLANFGTVIKIGELERDACYDLATRPMASMGISYEDDRLVEHLVKETGQRANLISIVCDQIAKDMDPNERKISEMTVNRALNSEAIKNALIGWQPASKKGSTEEKLNAIIVYSTIDRETFTLNDILQYLEDRGKKTKKSLELVQRSLSQLELAFILRRRNATFSYRVPLFKEIIMGQDLKGLLKWLLDSYEED